MRDDSIDDYGKIPKYAVRFARAMEAVVKNYPYQFFNFYDMWV